MRIMGQSISRVLFTRASMRASTRYQSGSTILRHQVRAFHTGRYETSLIGRSVTHMKIISGLGLLGGVALAIRAFAEEAQGVEPERGEVADPSDTSIESAHAVEIHLKSSQEEDLLNREQQLTAELKAIQAAYVLEEERDYRSEVDCLRKLGHFYLEKGNIDSLLYAAAIFAYCENVARRKQWDVEQLAFQEELQSIIPMISQVCGAVGTHPSPAVCRQRLEEIVQESKKRASRLSEDSSIEAVETHYREFSQQLRLFASELISLCETWLGPRRSNYAAICLGSLARDEAMPTSDFEFGFLVAKDDQEVKEYFRNLTYLIQFCVLCLGKTMLRKMNIPAVRDSELYDQMTDEGFSFDGTGAKGKGCKTPLGNRETFELIQTPKNMAVFVGRDGEQWWFQKEPHLPMELLNYTMIPGGDESLVSEYRNAVHEQLDQQVSEQGMNLRSYLSRRHLEKKDRDLFSMDNFADLEIAGTVFDLKKEVYRFLHLTIERLALFYRVEGMSTLEKARSLVALGILTEGQLNPLMHMISEVLHQRVSMSRPVDILAALSKEERVTLCNSLMPTFQSCFALKEYFEAFLANPDADLKSIHLKKTSDYVKGVIFQRMDLLSEAMQAYEKTLRDTPNRHRARLRLACLKARYRDPSWESEFQYLEREVKVPGDSRDAFFFRNSFGIGYFYNQQFERGLEQHMRAGEIVERMHHLDPTSFEVLEDSIRNHLNLGIGYLELHRRDEAEYQLFEKALKLFRVEKQLGRYHTAIEADLCAWIASFFMRGGDPKHALEFIRMSVRLDEKSSGINHGNISSSLNTLAWTYMTLGDFAPSEKYYKKSFEIERDRSSGFYAHRLCNLCNLYLDNQKYIEAKAVAEDIYQWTLLPSSKEYPEYMPCRMQKGVVEVKTGEILEGIKSLQVSLMDFEEIPEEKKNYERLFDAHWYLAEGYMRCLESKWTTADHRKFLDHTKAAEDLIRQKLGNNARFINDLDRLKKKFSTIPRS